MNCPVLKAAVPFDGPGTVVVYRSTHQPVDVKYIGTSFSSALYDACYDFSRDNNQELLGFYREADPLWANIVESHGILAIQQSGLARVLDAERKTTRYMHQALDAILTK